MVEYVEDMTSKLDTHRKFIDWLNDQLDRQGLSDREMARRGGISQSSISLVRSGSNPGLKTLQAIATGLEIPLSVVLQKAGLDDMAEMTATRKEADFLFTQLTDEDQDTVLTMMRALIRRKREAATRAETG